MDNQMNTVPASPQSSPKSRKRIWLWIFLGFACLCSIISLVAIVIYSNYQKFLKAGEPELKISAGSYEGTIYTAPEGSFSCDFKDIMYTSSDPYNNPYPVLYASEKVEDGTGTVFASNGLGEQYGVDYFKTPPFGGDDLAKSLADPETRQQTLQGILNNILLPHRGLKAEVTHQEFLQNDILFAIINDPEASTVLNGASQPLDYQEGNYIFAGKDGFYFVYSYLTPTNASQLLSPADMQGRVDGFYRGCQFQR